MKFSLTWPPVMKTEAFESIGTYTFEYSTVISSRQHISRWHLHVHIVHIEANY